MELNYNTYPFTTLVFHDNANIFKLGVFLINVGISFQIIATLHNRLFKVIYRFVLLDNSEYRR